MSPLCEALFSEVNPIPVKYAMNVLGWEAGECRLPLVEPGDATRSRSSRLCRLQALSRNKRFYVQMPGETDLRAFAV